MVTTSVYSSPQYSWGEKATLGGRKKGVREWESPVYFGEGKSSAVGEGKLPALGGGNPPPQNRSRINIG